MLLDIPTHLLFKIHKKNYFFKALQENNYDTLYILPPERECLAMLAIYTAQKDLDCHLKKLICLFL